MHSKKMVYLDAGTQTAGLAFVEDILLVKETADLVEEYNGSSWTTKWNSTEAVDLKMLQAGTTNSSIYVFW